MHMVRLSTANSTPDEAPSLTDTTISNHTARTETQVRLHLRPFKKLCEQNNCFTLYVGMDL